jgi:anaerobic magnesium-protoporphyrin IX monomethyl ester cyclase
MSAGEALSFLPLERVRLELEHFMRANVRQVKLVDRTFNHPDTRARDIFAALIALKSKYPESITNFHFEISASLLSEHTLSLLATAPKGLIQLEVGIQSTNQKTLHAVSRAHNTQKLLENTAALCRPQNLRVYVDLIAGLPMETTESFAHSFDDAYSVGADKIQLGFLKLLKGSRMRENAAQYGIVYSDHAPYEVLKTDSMTYEDLRRLHRIEHVLDMLYNQHQARKTLDLIIPLFDTPFAFFDQFTHHLKAAGYFARPQKKQAVFEQLFSFAKPHMNEDTLRETLCFDWLRLQRLGTWPKGLRMDTENLRKFFAERQVAEAYFEKPLSIREIERRCVLVSFKHLFDNPTMLLFDYSYAHHDESFIRQIKSPQ